MTIAICIKVNDGIVLATDSASTLSDKNGVIKVYENADKLGTDFNAFFDLKPANF